MLNINFMTAFWKTREQWTWVAGVVYSYVWCGLISLWRSSFLISKFIFLQVMSWFLWRSAEGHVAGYGVEVLWRGMQLLLMNLRESDLIFFLRLGRPVSQVLCFSVPWMMIFFCPGHYFMFYFVYMYIHHRYLNDTDTNGLVLFIHNCYTPTRCKLTCGSTALQHIWCV